MTDCIATINGMQHQSTYRYIIDILLRCFNIPWCKFFLFDGAKFVSKANRYYKDIKQVSEELLVRKCSSVSLWGTKAFIIFAKANVICVPFLLYYYTSTCTRFTRQNFSSHSSLMRAPTALIQFVCLRISSESMSFRFFPARKSTIMF